MRRILLVIALAGILGGCSWFSENVPSAKAETAAQHLLAIEVEYNGVFALMAEYENLKRCRVTSSKVCSDQAVVDRMRLVNTAFDVARDPAELVGVNDRSGFGCRIERVPRLP